MRGLALFCVVLSSACAARPLRYVPPPEPYFKACYANGGVTEVVRIRRAFRRDLLTERCTVPVGTTVLSVLPHNSGADNG